MSDGAALYIIDAGPGEADPFSAVAAARKDLTEVYSVIERVADDAPSGPRQFRRSFRPDIDRVLYDFTGPCAPAWAPALLAEAPGAVLMSARPPLFIAPR